MLKIVSEQEFVTILYVAEEDSFPEGMEVIYAEVNLLQDRSLIIATVGYIELKPQIIGSIIVNFSVYSYIPHAGKCDIIIPVYCEALTTIDTLGKKALNMKKIRRIISSAMVLCMLVSMLPAQAFAVPGNAVEHTVAYEQDAVADSKEATYAGSGKCGDNLTWMLDEEGTLTVSGTGDMYEYTYGSDSIGTHPWHSWKWDIQKVIIEDGVTSVGDCAFWNVPYLTEVTLGDDVSYIGEQAFCECSNLSSIHIGKGLQSTGKLAFFDCDSLSSVYVSDFVSWCEVDKDFDAEYGNPLGDWSRATVERDVTLYIDGIAVEGDLVIPDGITKISSHAFADCHGITSVTLPEGLSYIEAGAFSNCDNLTSVTIPKTLTALGGFSGCGFTEFIVPEWITSLEDGAFAGCANLKSVQLPESLESLGARALINCDGLTELTIPESVLVIGSSAFESCDNLETVTLPSGLTDIAEGTFKDCTELKSISVPDSVLTIGSSAFAGCDSLETVTLPSGLTAIADGTFKNCVALGSISIPSNAGSIGSSAFYGCSALKTVDISGNVTAIGDKAFQATAITDMILPNTVGTIGAYAFDGLSQWKNASVPTGVTSIGDYAYRGCVNLSVADLSDGLNDAGTAVFQNCTGLQSVSLSDNMGTVSQQLFIGCTSLAEIIIPAAISEIESGAFSGCSNLGRVDFLGDVPVISSDAFSGVTATCYYPEGNETYTAEVTSADYGGDLVWTYEGAEGTDDLYKCGENITWSLADGVLTLSGEGEMYDYSIADYSYAPWYESRTSISSIVIEEGITGLGDGAFYACTSANSVSMPSTLRSIGNRVFEQTGFTTVTIPEGVRDVGSRVFYDCNSLRTAYLPDSMTVIPSYMFYGCEYLNTVDLPEMITVIEKAAFSSCYGLNSMILPEGLTRIEDSAFTMCGCYDWYGGYYPCSNFTSISLPSTLVYIGSGAFSCCSMLNNVVIPAGIEYIGMNAFRYCMRLGTLTFKWDAPEICEDIFSGYLSGKPMKPTCYYPSNNEAWTSDLLQDYGGSPTWVGVEMEEPEEGTGGAAGEGSGEDDPDVGGGETGGGTDSGDTGETGGGSSGGSDGGSEDGGSGSGGSGEGSGESGGDSGETGTGGTCGTGLTWSLDESTGILTISGSGGMLDYTGESPAPWQEKRDLIRSAVIGAGVTTVGANAFSGCTAMETVAFAGGAPSIGENAFADVSATVYYPIEEATWTAAVKQNYGGTLTWVPVYGEHKLTDWTVFTAATCTEDGEERAACTECEFYLSREIEASGHSYGDWFEVTPATCTEDGEERRDCVSCDHFEMQTIAAMGHSYESVATEPTCTEQGYTSYTCTVCGDSYVDGYVEATGHNYGNWFTVTSATCTEDGQERRDCANCEHYETEVIPATGHNYESAVTAPTCTEQGCTTHTCSVCGDSFVDSYVDALGHTEVTDEGVEATCADGLTEGSHCSVCGTVLVAQEVIPAIADHSFTAEGICQVCGIAATAHGSCGTNVNWALSEDGTLYIYGSGAMSDYELYGAPWYSYRSDVQKIIVCSDVTQIGNHAFMECRNMVSVALPEGITAIGSRGFAYCDSMTSITIPEGVTSIGGMAFYGCDNLADVLIPEGVTSIGQSTFNSCKSLTDVTIPDSVTSIGQGAFSNCYSLRSVTLPNGLTSIAGTTFSGSGIVRITIPASVTSIGESAFSGCSKLTDVTLPNGLTGLGKAAFRGCYNLTDITLPNSITRIEKETFYGAGLVSMIIPDSVTSIGESAFLYCDSLQDIKLPDGLISIGSHAFSSTGLVSIVIPDSVTSIGAFGFSNSRSLKNITVSSRVNSIGQYMFAYCSNLESVVFRGNAPEFAADAFYSGTATAYYPYCNDSWTEDILQNYGGKVTWLSYDPCENGHSYDSAMTAPTCTEQGYTTHTCTVCGDSYNDSYVDATGHSYTYWTVVRVPTCTADGEDRRDCNDCDYYETRIVSATGHSEGEQVTEHEVAATCTTDGSYDTVVYCAVCDAELSRVTTTVPAAGHDYESVVTAPTCTEQGYATHTCIVCGDSYMDNYVEATGHAYGNWFTVTSATCTEDGQERRDCVNCDHYETNVIPATGHTEGEAITENKATPTCTEDGSYDRVIYCTACNAELSRENITVPATGHNYESVVTAPTCTEQGYATNTCTICGDSYVDSYGEATGHCYGEWTVVTAATCTEDGQERRNCGNCDHFETRITGATGHTVVIDAAVAASCKDGLTEGSHCAFCNETLVAQESVPATGIHAFVEGTCEACGMEAAAHGECGTSVYWVLTPEGVLHIYGSGEMDDFNTNNAPWDSYRTDILEVVIDEGVTSIGVRAFYCCEDITTVTLPERMTRIGADAFYICNSLTSIVIPKGVKSIGSNTFYSCENLTTVTFPEGLTSIGGCAFSGCKKLTSITIPKSVTYIETPAFPGCWSLTEILVEEGNSAYKSMEGILYSWDGSMLHTCPGAYAGELTVPEGVTHIGEYAFDDCHAIMSIILPESITEIGYFAIAYCSKLTSIVIPDSVTAIGEYAFCDCESLPEIIIPESVNRIGSYAFTRCKSLGNIVFEGDAPSIGSKAFSNVIANAYYPRNNETWTSDVMQDYGGTITWVAENDNKLQITTQPEDVTVAEGEKAVVTLEAEGEGLSYAWYFRNASGSKFSLTNAFTGPMYSVVMSEARSGRQIYCVITDINGYSVTTDTVTLTMATTPLEIIAQPEDVTVADGEPAEIRVEATGDGLTYTWYYKNSGASKFAKTTSFTGPTYSVTMSAARDGRQVYCVITDKYGDTVTTDTVTLSMEKNVAMIVAQPVDVEVENGEMAEVTVEATGDGLIYTWYYKNSGASKFSKTTSFTGSTYAVSMSAARSGRQVYCVVEDQYGNEVKSDVVTLTMRMTALEIVTQPEDVTVAEGETAIVMVEAVGDGLTYEWYYKNATGSKFTKTSTFTGPSYSLLMNASRSGRQVYCKITDCYGNTVQTETVVLTMETTPLEILTQPESVTVAAGETAEILVEATGDGLTYEWYYKNATSSKFTKTSTFTGSTYSLTMNTSRSGRHVYCVITDKYGNSVQTDIVTLNMASDLELLNQPEDVMAAAGETAEVVVEAVGEDMTYVWYYRNEGTAAFTKTTTFTGDTYSLKMTAARSGRQVYCVITDANGNTVATDIVTLSIG